MFSCEYCKNFKSSFFYRTPPVSVSDCRKFSHNFWLFWLYFLNIQRLMVINVENINHGMFFVNVIYLRKNYSLDTFLKFLTLLTEAATRGVLEEEVFLDIFQNLQVITCVRVSFLIKLQAWGTGIFSSEFCKISKNTFFTEHRWETASVLNHWQKWKARQENIQYFSQKLSGG